jgi:ferrous iron transport protein B
MKLEPSSLEIEIPELSVPRPKNVLYKTYVRIKDFFVIAFPILVVGSIVLELLAEYGILDAIVRPFAPFTVGFLGLPAVIIISLILGFSERKCPCRCSFCCSERRNCLPSSRQTSFSFSPS